MQELTKRFDLLSILSNNGGVVPLKELAIELSKATGYPLEEVGKEIMRAVDSNELCTLTVTFGRNAKYLPDLVPLNKAKTSF